MRFVVKHLAILLVFRVNEVQFHHQLTAITNTQWKCIFTSVIFVESFFSFRVEEESTCPTFGRTQYVGVGETTAVNNHVHIFQCLASADKVGHCNVFHIESCQIQWVGHFAFAIRTLLADNCCTDTCRGTTVRINTVLREFTFEIRHESEFHRLHLIVFEAFFSAAVHRLFAVE